MRTISISVPSGNIKLTLWEGTDDEERFTVKSLKRGKPYVLAYGVKHYLTEQEVMLAKTMSKLF